jgi:hypothetical protein
LGFGWGRLGRDDVGPGLLSPQTPGGLQELLDQSVFDKRPRAHTCRKPGFGQQLGRLGGREFGKRVAQRVRSPRALCHR